MKDLIKRIVPGPVEVTREALIVIAGALLATVVIGQLPEVREWIKKQWGDVPWLR